MAEAGVTVKQEPVEAVDLESRCDWCIQIGVNVVFVNNS